MGRERNEACWLLVSGRARKIQRKAGLGRPQGLSSLGLSLVGYVWDRRLLLPDHTFQGSGPHHHPCFPVEPALGPAGMSRIFFESPGVFAHFASGEASGEFVLSYVCFAYLITQFLISYWVPATKRHRSVVT